MVKLTCIYTKGGDKGKTSLGNGRRVSKNNLRIHAIGDVDEVNSWMGLCQQYVSDPYKSHLMHIQHDLFDVGADLCMPDDQGEKSKLRIQSNQVDWLEKKIDLLNDRLSPLNSFVLPGGSAAASHIHVARSVVRRCERSLVHLMQEDPYNSHVLSYINRLSDYLFVLARIENDTGKKDVLWIPGLNSDLI